MKHQTILTGAMLVLAGTLAYPVEAQRGPRGPGLRGGGPGGTSVETALRLREGLELDDQQVEQLDVLRLELLDERVQAMADAMALQSDLQAGEITQADMRDAMEGRRDAVEGRRGAVQDRLAEILTEDQLDELSESGRRGRRGRGVGSRGFRRGGPSIGQGQRFRRGSPRIRGRSFRRYW